MYDRGVGLRSIVVCGGQSRDSSNVKSCEELQIDVDGLPAATRWNFLGELPRKLSQACMLQVNGEVRVCVMSLLA